MLALMYACGDQKSKNNINENHRCLNCGMLTAKYPAWEQKIIQGVGDTLWFDGARCMFKILLDTTQQNINRKDIWVKEYYDQQYIDGMTAYYVIGSDILGPMGHELIPFKSEEAAAEFLADHKGERIVRFEDVDMMLVKTLAGKMKM
jgi:nitrous oxide reductase accessory protein NosL